MNTLFGIDRKLSTEAANPILRLVSAWPLWVTVLAITGVILLVWWLYRRERGGLKPGIRILLTFLRVSAVLLLLLMLFQPVLEWEVPVERASSLLLVLDDSQSMSIPDRYDGGEELQHVVRALWPEMNTFSGTETAPLSPEQKEELKGLKRAELMNRVLGSIGPEMLTKLAKEYDVKVFTASEILQKVAGEREGGKVEIPSVEPKGSVSRLGDLVRQAVQGERSTVSAVVMVGDGAVNAGEDFDSLARYLKNRQTRVYSVGIGDSREPKDMRVRSAEMNRLALVGDVVTVNVELESTGFRGESAEIKLTRDGQPVTVIYAGEERQAARVLLAEEMMPVEGHDVPKPQKVELAFRTDKAGTFTYSVQVTPRPEELVEDNNRVDVPVRVLDEKTKVLFVEGPPRWEYRYIKNILTRDEKIDVSCVLTSADFEIAQEGDLPISYFPSKEDDLFAYDVVILGDVPRTDLSDEQLAGIMKLVEKLGGGLLMIAGEKHAPFEYRSTVIEKMLPVDLDRKGLSEEPFRNKLFKPVLTPEGVLHPMTRFVSDVEANKKLWQDLPGMFWYCPIARTKPGATVLLTHPYARSTYGPQPLLSVQFYGGGKCAFLAVDETWRWRDRVGDKYQERFWGQIIRDLCQNKLIGKSKRFRVSTGKSEYRLGEKVGLFAQVLDERYEPVTKSSVEVELESPGRERVRLQLSGDANEPGRFHGEYLPQATGSYSVKLLTVETGLPEEAVAQRFLVRPSLLEFQDESMNAAGLARLSDATEGRFFHVDELGELSGALLRLKASASRTVNDDLWNAPLLFVVFAALFVTELILRKRYKLL